MKILGIFFNSKIEASLIEANHSLKMTEIKQAISSWSKRKLTLIGNCLISKIHMLSQNTNIIQALYLPETILNNIDSLLFQFVWGGSNPNQKVAERVKRST